VAALWGQWSRLAEGSSSWLKLREAGVLFYTGWGVRVAHGQEAITEVSLARLDDQWRPVAGTFRTLACDTLCCSYGFVPATELARLLGVRHEWQPRRGGFVPHRDPTLQTNVPGVFAAGDCAGIGGARLALLEGRLAGLAAANRVKGDQPVHLAEIKGLQSALAREQRFQRLYGDLFTPGPGLDELAEADTVICRCEEVTRAQVNQAIQQGADTLEAVKALTRCGMGGCQGRVCGPVVAPVVARELEQSRPATGQFRVRPPLFPIPLAAFEPTPDLSDVAAVLD
jgi:NAD(P)H-nitrite reductase large subunit